MYKRIGVTLLFVFASTQPAQAQTSPAQAAPRTITVTGTSELEVATDQAVVSVGVNTFEKDINEGKARHDQRMKELQDIAVKEGVQPADIQSSRVLISMERSERGKPRNVRLYSTITFKIRDLSRYDEVLSGFVNAGVESIQSAEFTVSDRAKYKAQARLLAVRAAREQAEAMADALGQKLGKPLRVVEGEVPRPIDNFNGDLGMIPQSALANVVEQQGLVGRTTGESIAPGQITFRISVTISFELI